MSVCMELDGRYIVSDYDDTLVDTAPYAVEFSNDMGLTCNLRIEDMHYDLPRLWGVPRDEATEHWTIFRTAIMPHLPAVPEARQALEELVTNGCQVDVLTSRHTDDNAMTVASAEKEFGGLIRDVHMQGVNWKTDPLAHTRTKRERLIELVPDVFVEDAKLHCNGGVDAGVGQVFMPMRFHNWDVSGLDPRVKRAQWPQIAQSILGELERRRQLLRRSA